MQIASYRNTERSSRSNFAENPDRFMSIHELRQKRAIEGREAARAARERQAVREYRVIDLSDLTTIRLPARTIIEMVVKKTGIPYAEIVGATRKRAVAVARHEAMYEVRTRRPDLSLPKIGRLFGGRDHTTVLYAVRKVEAEREGQPR
jgi:chromosomal replication initiation ATPase DnaA